PTTATPAIYPLSLHDALPISYMAEVHSSVRVVDLKSGRVLRSLPGLVRYLRHAQPTALLSALSHANVVAVVAHWLANSKARLVVDRKSTRLNSSHVKISYAVF